MSYSLRDLRLFVAVYEELSFTAAAAREHATQSGVSQRIRKLEVSLGVALFSRSKSSVLPTPAGAAFYQGCIQMLRQHERTREAVHAFDQGLEGRITVGLMPTMTRCVLAPALLRFNRLHPNVALRIVEGFSASLTQQVVAAELDFAIVPEFPPTAGIESRAFAGTPELLVSGPDSGLRHGKALRVAGLGGIKLVAPAPSNTRRGKIEAYLMANGARIEQVLEMDSMYGALDFVARSDWLAVLPAMMMADDVRAPGLAMNLLREPPLRLELVAIEPARTVMKPAAQVFLDMLRDEAGRANERVLAGFSPVRR